jgi:pyruvate dehydrogenase E2 component (dihydrolipoamide acetyltransferase)
MAELVLMPKLGFNMASGQLVKWHKKEGETVQKGDALFEVLTDKTNMVIESTVSGVVRKILVEEGETLDVFLPIAIIGAANEDIGPLLKEAAEKLGKTEITDSGSAQSAASMPIEGPVSGTASAGVADQGVLKLTPKAKKFIQDHRIDITQLDVQGTGFEDGITADDIEASIKRGPGRITPLAEKIAARNQVDLGGVKGTGLAGKITKADVEGVMNKKEVAPAGAPDAPGVTKVLKTIHYSGMRKIIGDRLSRSMYTAPHLYFTTALEMDALMALRQQVNSCQEQKVSLNDFMAAAVTKALQKYPELNASLQGDKIIQYGDVNMGIAVGLETGLIVPVIKRAQTKTVTQIAKEGKALIDKALKGTLMPDEYKGGTFTISNLGMYGIENFTAIINPPEAAILSVSGIKKTPVVVEAGGEDRIVIRSVMHITLSVDHRIIDGLVATHFINQIKAFVENPISIII